jgi:hypothetical protein
MSDPKELEDKLKHIRAGIEDARAGIEAAGDALQKTRQHLRDLLVGEALPTNSDVRAEMITSVQEAVDVVEKAFRELNQLQLRLLRDLSRLGG